MTIMNDLAQAELTREVELIVTGLSQQQKQTQKKKELRKSQRQRKLIQVLVEDYARRNKYGSPAVWKALYNILRKRTGFDPTGFMPKMRPMTAIQNHHYLDQFESLVVELTNPPNSLSSTL